jgi:sporulation protein YlmC with PRC-barrel domain
MKEENMPHASIILSASAISGDAVVTKEGENLGRIEDLMIDLEYGRIAYVVVSLGGFLGIGDRLLAIPWDVLSRDPQGKRFILDVNKERLRHAPGFDKDHWPQMADRKWGQDVHSYYHRRPYWEWSFK